MSADTGKLEKHGKKRKRGEPERDDITDDANRRQKLNQGEPEKRKDNHNGIIQETSAPSIEQERNGTSDNAEIRSSNEFDPPSKQRFIVFIGNLPYNTTDTALKAHFSKIKPASIRHITEKGTNKSKGFAFLEFEAFDRMRTCLKLYHHSLFEDGQGGKPRKLNVELTAGGGGSKSQARKEKLKAKNKRLSEQRKRSVKHESYEKRRQQQQGEHVVAKSTSNTRNESPTQLSTDYRTSSTVTDPHKSIGDLNEIHPSRRKLMQTG